MGERKILTDMSEKRERVGGGGEGMMDGGGEGMSDWRDERWEG